ncbi:G/U mismatch-specific uracil-DNA glycosylase [Mariprofundus ferrinatatus]|uniref:G/U mismatch-specific uracil-DNA glycosylase n=1 Tax=Mariprofundus ferrinatatus TaxID=1921087 RepID=A0A2K8L2E0_9PROT|nr:DNA-deoxyinosine glycosylase [Mariprofundus ferrinatatus]ATX81478.1 G/U mismatch-specific uracil-DNA glycosylase [Mariprofundus ferrinatatus]
MTETGFPYSANRDAKVLILGSMPSRKSLAAAQYYAHPQNGFWPIMGELFGFDPSLAYEARLESLRANGIALWDVAYQCVRPGSLDSAIEMESVVANDFATFLAAHPHIRVIFFNGRKAEELFRRLVLPRLPAPLHDIERQLLPSTSPANASIRREQKLESWKIVRQALEIA